MENDLYLRNKDIKNRVKAAFIFVIFTMVVSQLLSPVLPFLHGSAAMIIGTVIILCGRLKPEKGSLTEVNNKMTGTAFVVVLGAFMIAKLLSLIPSAALVSLFVNENNAEAFQDLDTTKDNILQAFIFMGLVTPFCEEAVFRGCIGKSFRKYGIWFAMLMSTLLFAIYHCNLFQLVSTFLPGIVLFYVALNYSLKWSVLLHFINNGLLVIGFVALKKIAPDSFFANYGEYIIESALAVAALCLCKKDNALEKVKQFLSGPQNEKGVYKAAIGNIWFILLIIVFAIMTAMILLMLDGSIDMTAIPAVS